MYQTGQAKASSARELTRSGQVSDSGQPLMPARAAATTGSTAVPIQEVFVTLKNPADRPDFIGYAGLATTTIVSVVALWLSYRSRRSALQERIHGAQLDALLDFAPLMVIAMRTALACNLAYRNGRQPTQDEQSAAKAAANEVLNYMVKAVLLFPASLLKEYKAVHTALKGCAQVTDASQAEIARAALVAAHTSFSGTARKLIGIDVLTKDVSALLASA